MPDLKYVGNGSYLLGVPARDLTGTEVSQLAKSLGQDPANLTERLVTSGYYVRVADKFAVLDATDSEPVVHLEEPIPASRSRKPVSKKNGE